MTESPITTRRGGTSWHEVGPLCRQYVTHWHDVEGAVHWQPWRGETRLSSSPAAAAEAAAERVKSILTYAGQGPYLKPPPGPAPKAEPEPARVSGNDGETRGPLTAAERGAIGAYIRLVADEMGLRDWTFKIAWPEPDQPHGGLATIATVEKWYGRRTAELAFRGRLADEPPDEVRHVVVHELAHLPFEPIGHLLDKAVLDAIGAHAYNVLVEAHRLLLEEAIDQLAEALAPSMPAFPGWSTTP